jgi:hypothetical protein
MTKEDFWKWFDNNKASLEKFISSEERDYSIYEELSDKLNQYNEFLIPELTIDNENKFILVISCDGMKQGISFAETLTENIRKFDNWIIVKYRQASPMESIPLDDLNLKRSDIFVQWKKSPKDLYSLTFFVKGFSSRNKNYELATLLHLDHTIGEYNAMTRIEGVEIKKLKLFQSKSDLKTLDDLRIELETT